MRIAAAATAIAQGQLQETRDQRVRIGYVVALLIAGEVHTASARCYRAMHAFERAIKWAPVGHSIGNITAFEFFLAECSADLLPSSEANIERLPNLLDKAGGDVALLIGGVRASRSMASEIESLTTFVTTPAPAALFRGDPSSFEDVLSRLFQNTLLAIEAGKSVSRAAKGPIPDIEPIPQELRRIAAAHPFLKGMLRTGGA